MGLRGAPETLGLSCPTCPQLTRLLYSYIGFATSNNYHNQWSAMPPSGSGPAVPISWRGRWIELRVRVPLAHIVDEPIASLPGLVNNLLVSTL